MLLYSGHSLVLTVLGKPFLVGLKLSRSLKTGLTGFEAFWATRGWEVVDEEKCTFSCLN